jgi:hypothetical protein
VPMRELSLWVVGGKTVIDEDGNKLEPPIVSLCKKGLIPFFMND